MRLVVRLLSLMTGMIFFLVASDSIDADEYLESQRLKNLQDTLKAGDSGALDSFWRTITEQGTPMVAILASFLLFSTFTATFPAGSLAHP